MRGNYSHAVLLYTLELGNHELISSAFSMDAEGLSIVNNVSHIHISGQMYEYKMRVL